VYNSETDSPMKPFLVSEEAGTGRNAIIKILHPSWKEKPRRRVALVKSSPAKITIKAVHQAMDRAVNKGYFQEPRGGLGCHVVCSRVPWALCNMEHASCCWVSVEAHTQVRAI
jgi:hypothetical protein